MNVYDPYHDLPTLYWWRPLVTASTPSRFRYSWDVKVKRGRGGRRKRRARNAIYRSPC